VGPSKIQGEDAMTDKAKILLVDDDPDFVDATLTVLESEAYDVSVAFDGDEGLAKARAEKPDLIILDVIMPTKDGFAVCEQLKSDPDLSNIPVMMLTSFAERKGETSLAVTQGMMLEAEDYVDKPVPPQELLRRVKALLERLQKT
jgi:two-component system alkaline phosphatase synthesis response regulator PhoP